MTGERSKCPHCGKGVNVLESTNGLSLQKRVIKPIDDKLFNSIFTGGMTGVIVGQFIFALGTIGEAVQFGSIAGSVVVLGVWLLHDDVKLKQESIVNNRIAEKSSSNKVIDNKGHKVEVQINERGRGGRWAFVDLPISAEVMKDVSISVLMNGGAFSRPWLCNHRRLLSQKQYHDLRRTLIKFDMLETTGNSTKPTAVGRSLLRYYAGLNMRSDT